MSTVTLSIAAVLLFVLGSLVSLAWDYRRLEADLRRSEMERQRLLDQLLISRGAEPVSNEAVERDRERSEKFSMGELFASSGEMMMSEVGGDEDERDT